MGHLRGFTEYYRQNDASCIFENLHQDQTLYNFHIHGGKTLTARVVENQVYDVRLSTDGREDNLVPKINILYLYQPDLAGNIKKLLKKKDKKGGPVVMNPIYSPKDRFFVKNKTLYPLMKDRQVLFFTLVDGSVIRGRVDGFSRYEIRMLLKGGVPLTLLRHAITDLRDKAGHCYLKSVDQEKQSWKTSAWYNTAGGEKEADQGS